MVLMEIHLGLMLLTTGPVFRHSWGIQTTQLGPQQLGPQQLGL